MWINRQFFEMVIADNKRQQDEMRVVHAEALSTAAVNTTLLAQKAKDDITVDWMRHRINALEKHNALLLAKVAGIHVPVPEIVPTRPGTLSEFPSFQSMPSFEDVGEDEAKRLGISHAEDGLLVYKS